MSSFEPNRPPSIGEPFSPLEGREVSLPASRESIFGELVRGAHSAREREEEQARAAALDALAAEIAAAEQRGRAAGIASVYEEFGDAAQGFAAALADLAQSRKSMREHYESALLAVAVQVAEKIVGSALEVEPTRWLGMIAQGVGRTLDKDLVKIRLGHALHHFVAARRDELAALIEDVREFDLIDDPSLEPTECVIETQYGDLDLGLGSQLETLAVSLLGEP